MRHGVRLVVGRAVGQHPQRGALQVVRHLGQRALLIVGDQRFQDGGVLGVTGRLPAAGLGQLVDADVPGGPVGEGPQLALHRLAGRRRADPVIVGVCPEPLVEVAGLGRPAHRGQHPLGLGPFLGPEVPDRHRQRQRLQQDPARVDVVEFLRIQARHPGPLVRLDLDQALLLQHPQHLTQRGAADAELGGQAHLGQLGARPQRAVKDAFPQVSVHVRDGLPGFGQVDLADVRHLHDTRHGQHSPRNDRSRPQFTSNSNCIQFTHLPPPPLARHPPAPRLSAHLPKRPRS